MLSGFGKLVEGICFTDCKEPLEGFLPLCVKVPWGSYGYFWNLAGNGFLWVIRNENYPIVLNKLQEIGFYLKGWYFVDWMLKCWKLKKNLQEIWRNLQDTQAEPVWGFRPVRWGIFGLPRNYTGGTHSRVPPDPPDLKNNTVRDFDPRDDFQNFRKLLK